MSSSCEIFVGRRQLPTASISDVVISKRRQKTTTSIQLPKELPSVKEAVKKKSTIGIRRLLWTEGVNIFGF